MADRPEGVTVRLSAAEKGKQKADADLPCDVAGALRRPAPGTGPDTEIDEAPPSPPPLPPRLLAARARQLLRNEATLGRLPAELQQLRGELDGRAGVPRHPLGPSAASEIEEVPPSPPPPSRLLALNEARGLGGLGAAVAGLGGMVDELRRKEAALALLVSQLQQLRWERGEGASRFPGSEGASRFPGSEPRQEHAGAAGLQMLEREMGTIHESLNSSRDRMLALRLQEEEVQAYRESLKAREEFWKPVPVHQRKNSKVRHLFFLSCIHLKLASTTCSE